MSIIEERITALRSAMKAHQLDYYFVPAADAHQNEYVPYIWKRRQWISGFSGSAGDVLVGHERCYLWTDGRYALQAKKEVEQALFDIKIQHQGADGLSHFLGQLDKPVRIGVDPKVLSLKQTESFLSTLSVLESELVFLEENLIDVVRSEGGNPHFESVIEVRDVHITGQSAKEKLSWLRAQLTLKKAQAIVLSSLDEIAWLFNVRGDDVACNPLVVSYAIITQDQAMWFVGKERVSVSAIEDYLASQGIEAYEYDEVKEQLQKLTGKVWCDPRWISQWMINQLSDAAGLYSEISPILLKKAVKNEVELEGMRRSHVMDGVALVQFLHWLENHWQEGLTEYSAAQRLLDFRKQHKEFIQNSFPTISGFGPQSAIIHYSAKESSAATITDQDILLLDSGGLYLGGTTDVTRTLHLGQPTLTQKKHYTLVLKGHLALRHSVFPKGTNGTHLDAIARMPLWQHGLNFYHGTGHGVGAGLCVHEGPMVISPRMYNFAFEPNMILSNEPGVYFDGDYGIRIENLIYVSEKQGVAFTESTFGPFYGFEDLTMVPYALNLVDNSLLDPKEIKQLNEYHQKVYETLSPYLDGEVEKWLKEKTGPISVKGH